MNHAEEQIISEQNNLGKTQNLVKIITMSNELSKLETRRKIALSNAEIGIWEWNLMTDKIIWDETMHLIYDVDRDFTPTFDAILSLIHKDDMQRVKEQTYSLKRDTTSLKESICFRIKVKNEFRWILSVCKKILNSNNQIVKVIGTNQLLEKNISICASGCKCVK